MRILILLPLLLSFTFAEAQDSQPTRTETKSKVVIKKEATHPCYFFHSVIATLSVGFVDYYRSNYTLPPGFGKNNFSGFLPAYGKVEYAVGKHIGLAATADYDAFYCNYYQLFYGNGNTFKRFRTDKMAITGGGLSAFYHFKTLKKLDVFAGVGLSLTRIYHTSLPQGDSTVFTKEHTVSPAIRAGARYYIADRGSIYADFGYDKQSIFSIGFSARFFRKQAVQAKS